MPLNNYLVFNDVDGLYTYTFEAERKVSVAEIFLSLKDDTVHSWLSVD